MEGILGFISGKGRVRPGILEAMGQRITHFGPCFTEHTDGSVGLGFRGSALCGGIGPQPRSDLDSSNWIVFDGSVQNRADLMVVLRSRGHLVDSRSDAELVLHAWQEWGDCCVDHFRGGFAFAIVDLRLGYVFLARDPLGLRPLATCRTGDGFAFASEPDALRLTPGFDGALDLTALDQFLWLGYVPSPRGRYRQMASLPPAHRMRVDFQGRAETPRRYWTLGFDPEPGLDRGAWEERVAVVLRTSIERHCAQGESIGLLDDGDWPANLIQTGLNSTRIPVTGRVLHDSVDGPGGVPLATSRMTILSGAGGAEVFGCAKPYRTWLRGPSGRVEDWLRINQVIPASDRATLWRPECRPADRWDGTFEDLWSQTRRMTHLQRVQFMDLNTRLPDGKLRWTDALGTQPGLNMKTPLVDQDLLEVMTRIPARFMTLGQDSSWGPLALPQGVARCLRQGTPVEAGWTLSTSPAQPAWIPGPQALDRLRCSPYFAGLFLPAAMDRVVTSGTPAVLHLLLNLEEWLRQQEGPLGPITIRPAIIHTQPPAAADESIGPGEYVRRIQSAADRYDSVAARSLLRRLLSLWPASSEAAEASRWLAGHPPPPAPSHPYAEFLKEQIGIENLRNFRQAFASGRDHPEYLHANCPELFEPMTLASRQGFSEVVVCGSGSVARRALGLAYLLGLEIRCFTDRNPSLHRKTIQGVPIVSLDQGLALGLPCVVGTMTYASEVAAEITLRAQALGMDPPAILAQYGALGRPER